MSIWFLFIFFSSLYFSAQSYAFILLLQNNSANKFAYAEKNAALALPGQQTRCLY